VAIANRLVLSDRVVRRTPVVVMSRPLGERMLMWLSVGAFMPKRGSGPDSSVVTMLSGPLVRIVSRRL
jgi:hypothetical protein